MLWARAPVAGKLVSCVEVVKREIERDGGGKQKGKWWQYSGVGEDFVEVVPGVAGGEKGKKGQGKGVKFEDEEKEKVGEGEDKMDVDVREVGDQEVEEEEDEGEEPAFEPLTKDVQKAKEWKSVPVLTVFLSRVPVKELEALYGVQTNSSS